MMGFSSGLYAALGMMVSRTETQWPPKFPRQGTLLTPYDDPTTPREAWGSDEWRAYAAFLEEAGGLLAQQLRQDREALHEARSKLSRRRKSSTHSSSCLLLAEPPAKKKPGRKFAKHTRQLAESALSIRAEMESSGKKTTNRLALEQAFAAIGQRKMRAHGREANHILNIMSQLSNRQVIPTS
jgi:hypothetical protein